MASDPAAKPDVDWSARVRSAGPEESKVYARSCAFSVGQQASLKDSDAFPSAIEYLLGALGADLVQGFRREASRRGVAIEGIEAAVSGRLGNVLVHLGVIGEEGHPGFARIDVTLYVTLDAEEAVAEELWARALARSPLYATLKAAAEVRLNLRLLP